MTLFDLFESCQNIRFYTNVRIYDETYNGAWKVYNMEKALDEYGTHVIDYFHFINDKDIEVHFK